MDKSEDESWEMSGDVNALQAWEGKLEEKVVNWKENLILSLSNFNKMEKDAYVKYKLFKHDDYGKIVIF